MLRRRILAAATTVVLGLSMAIGGTGAAMATQPDQAGVCAGEHLDGTEQNTLQYTAPSGFLVASYCVKAGSVKQGGDNGPVIVPVNPPSATVTIDHPTKDSISHFSVVLVAIVVPDQPADVVQVGDWTAIASDCVARTITEQQTTTTTTTTLQNNVWVASAPVSSTEDRVRPMTAGEIALLCPTGPQPDAIVVPGEWIADDVDCDAEAVTESRTVTTTPFVLENDAWVAGTPTTTTDERTRDLTPAERDELCPTVEEPPVETQGDKVFVCKYIGTPGVDERLQTGNNPISVSVNSIKPYLGIGSSFADGQGRSVVIAVDDRQGGGQTGEPSIDDCAEPQGPVVVTGQWTASDWDCDTETVTETRTVTTTTFSIVEGQLTPSTSSTVQTRERAMTEAELEEYCPVDEQPADDVETSDWVVSVFDCDTETVTETRTITTTSYELVDREWVADEPVETVETRERPMTEAELEEYCPVDVEPNALEVVDEWTVSGTDCDTESVTEIQTTTTTPYVLVDRAWVLGEPVVTTEERTRPMTDAELDEFCPVDIEPAAVEVLGDWMVTDSDCDTTTVTESRTVSTTPFVLVDRVWVAGETVESTEDRVRAMTDAERADLCPAVPTTPVTPVTPLGNLPTLALDDPQTLALTGVGSAVNGLGIAGLVALMAGLGLVLLRRPELVSEED